jgi:hypothetical protein
MIRYAPTRITLDMTTVQQSIARIPPRHTNKHSRDSLSHIQSPSFHSDEQSSPSATPKSTLKGKSVIRHMYDEHAERKLLAQEDGAHNSSGDYSLDSYNMVPYDEQGHDTRGKLSCSQEIIVSTYRTRQQDIQTPDALHTRTCALKSARTRSIQVRQQTPDTSQTSHMVIYLLTLGLQSTDISQHELASDFTILSIEPALDQENDEERQMMMFLQSPEGATVLERMREPELVGGTGRLDDTPPQQSRFGRMFFREGEDG